MPRRRKHSGRDKDGRGRASREAASPPADAGGDALPDVLVNDAPAEEPADQPEPAAGAASIRDLERRLKTGIRELGRENRRLRDENRQLKARLEQVRTGPAPREAKRTARRGASSLLSGKTGRNRSRA